MCTKTLIVYSCGLQQSIKLDPCPYYSVGNECIKHVNAYYLEEVCPWICAQNCAKDDENRDSTGEVESSLTDVAQGMGRTEDGAGGMNRN